MIQKLTLFAILAVVMNCTTAERSTSHEAPKESECTFFCEGGSHATGLLQSLSQQKWDVRIDLDYFTHTPSAIQTGTAVEEACKFSSINILPVIGTAPTSDVEDAIQLWISSKRFSEGNFKGRLKRLAPAVSDNDSRRLFQLTKELCVQANEPLQARLAAAIFLESTSLERPLLLLLLTLANQNAAESPSLGGELVGQLAGVASQCPGICSIASYVSLYLHLKSANVSGTDFDAKMAESQLSLARNFEYCYPFRTIEGRKDSLLTVSLLADDISGNALGPFSIQVNEHDFMECIRSGNVDTQPRLLLRQMFSDLISGIKSECHDDPAAFRSLALDIELLLLRCLQSDDFELQTIAMMHYFDFFRIYKRHFGEEWRLALADQNLNVFQIGLVEKNLVFRQPLVSYHQLLQASGSAAKQVEQELGIEPPSL